MSECCEYSQNATKDKVLSLLSSFNVLVIDHDTDFLASVACLLYSCSFDVTSVDHSGLALRMLSEEENEFDLVLIDIDMIDMDVHSFLKLAKNMDLLSMVMAEDGDDTRALEALKSGAFYVVKKPLTLDVVMHIRQHVMKERIKKNDKCLNKRMIRKAATQEESIQGNKKFGSKRKDRDEPMEHVIRAYHDNNLVYISAEDTADDDRIMRKKCMDWTQELHEKFLNAIGQLGEGRCYPKEILELMGVPGLTRRQVASHLQMCRDGKWKSNEKGTSSSSSNHALSRKFGRMPSLQIDQNDEDGSNLDLTLSLSRWQTEVNQTSTGSPTMNESINPQNVAGQGSVHRNFTSN